MNINFLKIFGWVLLVAGLAVIVYGLFASYQIFTTKAEPPAVFKIAEAPKNQDNKQPAKNSNVKIEDLAGGGIDVGQLLGDSLGNLVPVGDINKMTNLAVWSMFVAILFWGGGAIAALGIKMIK